MTIIAHAIKKSQSTKKSSVAVWLLFKNALYMVVQLHTLKMFSGKGESKISGLSLELF